MKRINRVVSEAIARFALPAVFAVIIMSQPLNALAAGGDGDDPDCEPQAVLAKAQEDQDMADKLMSRTVEGILRRLKCDLPRSVMDDIKNDPVSAEVILREKNPACYDKFMRESTVKAGDDLNIVESAVADALELQMSELGCQGGRDKIEALIKREYRVKLWSANYMNCVQALHQVRAAEESYKIDKGEYTADIGEIASFLVPGGESVSAEAAEAAVAKSCCSVPSCDVENNPGDAWNGDFGIDLSDDDGLLIYGYPIGGPDCLIMVSPVKDDPDNFVDCYEESENSAKKSEEKEEEK